MKSFTFFAGAVASVLFLRPTIRLQAEAPEPGIGDEPIELEAVLVTPFASPRSADDLAQPIFLIRDDRLHRQAASTLGETLDGTAGVSATSFGPGSSRPIIRGMGGDRIRVLSDGLGTFDASVISPDHAVSIEPVFAERIEVIRGPATLRFGSSALGGVVNTVDGSLPDLPPEKPFTGEIEGRYGSNNGEWVAAGRFSGGTERIGWHASGLKRDSGDIRIPVPPESEYAHEEEAHSSDEEPFDGTLPNSAVKTENHTIGLSTFWDKGHAGVAYTRYDSFYGIPGGHEHESGDEDTTGEPVDGEPADDGAEAVRIDLQQQRLRARAGLKKPIEWLEEATLRLGYGDYEHVELEGDAIGTRFTSKAFEGRLEAVHSEIKGFVGAFGLEYARTNFAAAGDEAFLPPTLTGKGSLFAVESYTSDALAGEIGLRIEDQTIDVTDGSASSIKNSGLSASAGIVWRFLPDYSIGLSVSRTERLPNAQELLADGPHAATGAYEIGDPGLGKETAWSSDLVLRKRSGWITGQLSVFANRFDDYIFEEKTGEVRDDLPVYRFVGRDAAFIGGELEAVLHAHDAEDYRLDFTVTTDYVHATDKTSDQPLPRIPPFRFGLGADFATGGFAAGASVRYSAQQERTAPGEAPTDSYSLVSAYLSYAIEAPGTTWTLFLRGTNLTDQEARLSTSFLKDEVTLPGRNLVSGVRIAF
ncbi:MAG: TonB-dependent receptor [Opitutaceae bacterium]